MGLSWEEFCDDSPIWDNNLTWYNTWPQFTACFQQTVLVWVPCGLLWLSIPGYAYYITHSSGPNSNVGLLNVAKMVVCAIIVILNIMNITALVNEASGNNVFRADLVATVIEMVTMILVMAVIYKESRRGFVTSGILFMFWFFSSLCAVIPLYTSIMLEIPTMSTFRLNSFYVRFGLLILQVILHSFANKVEKPFSVKPLCPEVSASFPSRVCFQWMTSTIFKGFRKQIAIETMWELHPRDQSRSVVPDFEEVWQDELQVCSKWSMSMNPASNNTPSYTFLNSIYENGDATSESTPLIKNTHAHNGVGKQSHPKPETESKFKRRPSLLKTIITAFSRQLFVSQIWKLFSDMFSLSSPIILRYLIEFSGDETIVQWKGYLYAIGISLTSVMASVLLNATLHYSVCVGMNFRAVVVSAIYKKALTMTSEARKFSTVGEIVNLMSVDAQHLLDLMLYAFTVWSCPLQIIVSLYLLYDTVGVAAFSGMAVVLILLPCNIYLANRMKRLQVSQMKLKDHRMRLMGEVLSGMKILKLYTWEPLFERKVSAVRRLELTALWWTTFLQSLQIVCWNTAPYTVSLTTFGVFIFVSSDHYLSADIAFVSMSLFNILRVAINLLPMTLAEAIKSYVSIQRINDFLCHDDLDPDNAIHDPNSEYAISVANGTFTWDPAMSPTLTNINMWIPEGKLIAIVGKVGAGKSSLISAMLGEMKKIQGKVTVKGSVAYVSQEAWIQNLTVRDNILFGKAMERNTYDKIIEACALGPDLEILAGGDLTEIGEKGINVSGGQKQRVSLARAVYNDADIYLLDDPLSAVDSHVGKHIFERVIGDRGLLANKTRVLVTHGVHWLPMVDMIAVVTDGEISEYGSYDELMSHNGAFAELLSSYLEEKVTHDKDESDDDSEEFNALVKEHLSFVQSRDFDNSVDSDMLEKSKQFSMSVEVSAKRSLKRAISREVSRKDTKEFPKVGQKLVEEETVLEGSMGWSIFSEYIHAVGTRFIVLIVSSVIAFQATAVYANVWLSEWTDDLLLGNDTIDHEGAMYRSRNDLYLGIYGFLGIIQVFFMIAFAFSVLLRMLAASGRLHTAMLSNIIRAPMSFFDTTPTGRIMNRFSLDLEITDSRLPQQFRVWIDNVCRVLGIVFVICYSTPIFIVLILPVFIIYFILQRFYIITSRHLKRLESTSRSPIYNHFSETITGAAVIRAFKAQDRFIVESESRLDLNQVFFFAGMAANRWLAVRLSLLGNIILLGTSLYAVIARGAISEGVVGLTVSYTLQITAFMDMVVRMTSELEANMVSVERLSEYAQTKTEASWYEPETKPPAAWPSDGVLYFDSYSTRYRPGLDLVLKGIKVTFNAGEKIGIVGRTGAGKSSLTLALFRLIEPADGTIRIDGRDIRTLGLHDLREKLTILPQDPVIFSGSLRFNLDPMDKYKDDDIWLALEQAHLKAFVVVQAGGLLFECGEGGHNLSVGQRQLMCLARSLLKKTKILILDEATAAVDLETDKLIQETIRTAFADSTVIAIAHRINTIMDYDKVLVLDKGMIKEFDSPEKLLKNEDSAFFKMAKDAGLV